MYERNLGRLAKVTALWRELRRREREGHLPATRAVVELLRLQRRNGVSPMYYLLAGLYRRELTWEEKDAYVGQERLKEYLDRINPPSVQHLVRDKVTCHGVLNPAGVPTPPFYGLVGEGDGRPDSVAVLREPRELLAVLDRHGVDTVCFKHVSGTRGRGFYKVAIDRSSDKPIARLQPKGEEMELDELWRELSNATLFDGYFCQGVVEQHPAVARYNPTSLNTFRCWMVKNDDGEWYMYDAVLRMGIGQTAVDNFSQGGLAAPIDTETGVLRDAVEKTIDRRVHCSHPVTGVRFSGERLPMWGNAVDLCRRAASLFPYELVAVDVAFGVDQPVVIELGATPDDHQILAGRGFGPMLRHLLARAGKQ